MRYSIDTSAIIHAWRRSYPRDVFPTLSTRLSGLIDAGTLIATDEVLQELKRKDDEISQWASENRAMFVPLDEKVESAVKDVLRDHRRLLDTRKNRSGADPFVIALAIVRACKVVTQEPATGNLARPNIPDVCAALHDPCLSVLEFLREQRWVFV